MTPGEFLLARLAEAEDVARRCNDDSHWSTLLQGDLTMVVSAPAGDVLFQVQDEWQALQITRHDPATVLADIAAKRRILALHTSTTGRPGGDCATCGTPGEYYITWPCDTVLLLCEPFADHPDYDPAWSVDG